MVKSIKKATEFNIATGFCAHCNANRFFYRRKDALKDDKWFCQLCGEEGNDEDDKMQS